jgi:hypothetical protein
MTFFITFLVGQVYFGLSFLSPLLVFSIIDFFAIGITSVLPN